jgi:hypothetical protein
MIAHQALTIWKVEERRWIEISFERVATWTLIFTNAFFVSYFLGRLFQWI